MPGGDAETAHAKVNLFLHVTGRRPDGYHLLDSLVVFAGAADRIALTPSDSLRLSVEGPFGPALAAEADNLVLRAARMLAADVGITPSGTLTLEKHIPVASGIGGGSADAAAALRLFRRAWGVDRDIAAIAARVGADVPVCLASRPSRMRGIGEHLTPAPYLPPCGLVLVNPGIPLSTVSVFRARAADGFSAEAELPPGWNKAQEMATSLSGLTNDLEAPAIALVPVIQDVLHEIRGSRGCLLARMSGSGATCFGLYDSAGAAEAAAATIGRPGWWTWGGALAGA